ncbi:hypothetical protein L484_019509 [Morus notabilis]|uniref:Uncharacterized protein n=1 Tax=Morus notabilis TaxID=981085 RepID=W9R3N4_9ROSA|nr:hypothetical protein L484_019509 [Morus notabilis]
MAMNFTNHLINHFGNHNNISLSSSSSSSTYRFSHCFSPSRNFLAADFLRKGRCF